MLHYREYNDAHEFVFDYQHRTNSKCNGLSDPIWIKNESNNNIVRQVLGFHLDYAIIVSMDCKSLDNINLHELFTNWTYLDGTPCGISEDLWYI